MHCEAAWEGGLRSPPPTALRAHEQQLVVLLSAAKALRFSDDEYVNALLEGVILLVEALPILGCLAAICLLVIWREEKVRL